MLEVFMSAFDEVPAKVCKPVNVFATFNTGIFAPARVVAPVPPLAIGSVPVVNALVEVAYTAPPEVNEVRFVPPLEVPKVPAKVTAPDVAVLGVKPLSDVWNVATPSTTLDETLIKSTPFQAQTADSPAMIVTPVVGPTPTSLIDWVLEVLLITT
jgi:hypothetical protein